MEYSHKRLNLDSYIELLYKEGFQKSKYEYDQLKEIIEEIGIFRFKGYVKAFRKDVSEYSIDDVLELYNLDRQISINLFKSTSQIEIKLKTYLIEIAYSLTNNPFFYLLKDSYVDNFKLSDESIYDWEVKELKNKKNEIYLHYRDYYLGKYDFNSNKEKYLKDKILIDLNSNMNINYPPFHYFIENVTLGSLINIISKLNVNDNSILKLLANRFGMYDKDVFLNYLLRLKELRNRCAHNGRLFNRNYRGVKAYGLHKNFRKYIYEHKLLDVYFSMQILLEKHYEINDTKNLEEIFVNDILNNCDKKREDFIMNIIKIKTR